MARGRGVRPGAVVGGRRGAAGRDHQERQAPGRGATCRLCGLDGVRRPSARRRFAFRIVSDRYDAPRDASNYVHRVGRAARAGATGRRHYADQARPGQGLRPRAALVAPPTKVPRESVGALSSFIPDYKSCLKRAWRSGSARAGARQPAGSFGRGFLNAPARSRSSSSSSAPAPAAVTLGRIRRRRGSGGVPRLVFVSLG